MSTITPACPEIDKQRRKSSVAITVALVASALFFGFLGFCAFYPGPADDSGTPLNKLEWQIMLSNGQSDLKNKDYAEAQKKFSHAEGKARSFGDGKARLEDTLKNQADLYTQWEGHAEDLEKVNREVLAIESDRARNDFNHAMEHLGSLEKPNATGVAKDNTKLLAEAQLPTVLATASKLYGRALYAELEQLLKKAIAIDERLLGPDSTAIAQLDAKLAEGLLAQRKMNEVRGLLLNARRIRKANEGQEPGDYVRALNKLGEFDLDQSDYKNAEPELSEALALARKLKGRNDLLATCLRNQASLLQQCGEADGPKRARELLKEADQLDKQSSAAPQS